MTRESSDIPMDYTNVSTYNQFEDKESRILVVIGMLSVFSVVGTIGNGLVMYVFSRKGDRHTYTIFILALAGTDLITCLIIIPFSIVVIYYDHGLKYDILCKIYHFLITCNVPLSAFIMVAIAIDRYFCICHPFLHAMTIKRAKVFVSILVATTSVLGLITSLGYAIEPIPGQDDNFTLTGLQDVWNETININVSNIFATLQQHWWLNESITKIDSNNEGVCALSNVILSKAFFLAYQKLYASFYLISLLIVMILYALIYRSVLVRRAMRLKQKAHSVSSHTNSNVTSATTQTTQSALLNNEKKSVDAKDVQVEVNGSKVRTKAILPKQVNCDSNLYIKQTGNAVKDRKDHNRLANIKTAVMLFVVTIVFTVAFLPAWLMAHELVAFNIVVFYIYFSYNVANPFIYAFMNQMFRDDLKRLIRKCHTCVSKP